MRPYAQMILVELLVPFLLGAPDILKLELGDRVLTELAHNGVDMRALLGEDLGPDERLLHRARAVPAQEGVHRMPMSTVSEQRPITHEISQEVLQ